MRTGQNSNNPPKRPILFLMVWASPFLTRHIAVLTKFVAILIVTVFTQFINMGLSEPIQCGTLHV